MQKQICWVWLCLAQIIPLAVWADPIISNLDGLGENGLIHHQTLTLEGVGFGVKSPAAPLYFSDFENESLGATPAGWNEVSGEVFTSDDFAHAGSRSLKVNTETGGDFCQITKDLGRPMNNFFLSANFLIDRNDDCGRIQFKAWRLSSSPGVYYADETSSTTQIMNNYWYYITEDRTYWGNNNTEVNYDGGNHSTQIGCAEDLFVFNDWQRIEQYVQGSSTPSAADGLLRTKRVGRSGYVQERNGLVTHDADDDRWQHIMMGQTWRQTTGCTIDTFLYFDDLYVDDTQARVELGNAPIFEDCTQREIQIPSVWEDNEISVQIHSQALAGEEQLFLFVIDSEGNVSPGYEVNLDPTQQNLPTPSNDDQSEEDSEGGVLLSTPDVNSGCKTDFSWPPLLLLLVLGSLRTRFSRIRLGA